MKSSHLLVLIAAIPAVSGCAALMSRASEQLAADLRTAVVNHNDPETVRDGAPAWLLMTDALAAGSPGNPGIQAQAAQLYAAYAGEFAAADADRARRLSARARGYGRAALCARRDDACGVFELPFQDFERRIDRFKATDADAMFAAAIGELAYIRARSEDWIAIAELPRAQALLERVVEVEPTYGEGSAQALLGVLHSLRPPALGGRPEVGRDHFETALEISGGRDLMTKVLYAEHYARVTYDRALHDRLLNEVLEAEVEAEGFTLTNALAQRRARVLLANAGDYFFEE